MFMLMFNLDGFTTKQSKKVTHLTQALKKSLKENVKIEKNEVSKTLNTEVPKLRSNIIILKNTDNDTENILSIDFQRMLLLEKDKFHTSRSNKLPEFTTKKIIFALENEYNLKIKNTDIGINTEQVKTILAVHFQQGATSRSCDGNTSINIFNQDYNLTTIRKVLKQTGNKNSERKLARSLATYIHSVCEILEIPGNLYNKISRLDPEGTFTTSEQAWLSDFQADNKDCPPKLRDLINKSFMKTFLKGKK